MAKRKHFGGAPVSEGVRLEVGKYTVFAVRKADKDIAVRLRREPREFLRLMMRIPFLRGATRLVRDVYRFFDGLAESAEFKPQKVVRGTAAERAVARALHVHPQSIVTLTSALAMLLIGFICLFAAPLGLEALLASTTLTRAWVNGLVCALRAAGFLAAIGLCGRLRVFKRLLMYRCAINMTTNCYECGGRLTPENAASYPRYARRSEAAFLISVLLISLVLFSLARIDNLLLAVALRLLTILAVAAVLNEPFSALEVAELNWATRILRTPIDLFQHMTTAEPHPQMLELTVCAFKAALGELGEADAEIHE